MVTGDGLSDQKAFYKVKIGFILPLWIMVDLSITIGSNDEIVAINFPPLSSSHVNMFSS